MRTRTLVVSLVLLCLAIFAAAFVLYDRSEGTNEPAGVEKTALLRDHSPVLGPEDAPVTIVEFFDPSCEGCRAMYPYVKQFMATYPNQVRLVLRYVLFHKGSEEAVRILETARQQGIYEPVLDAVMEAQPQWHDDPDVAAAWDAAKLAGLDVEAARASMNASEIDDIIQQDAADVKAVRISGTPTFYVNGEKLNRLGPQELYDLVTSKVESSR